MRENALKRKLAAGEVVAGPFIFLTDAHVMGATAAAGFDFACCCLEHGRISFETLQTMVYAADAAGITPIARLSDGSRQSILRCLEIGVQGILLPWCENAEMARELVRHSRFHPVGQRGAYTHSYASDYARFAIEEHMAVSNREVLVMAQVESPTAVANAGAIASVEGLDAVMVGPGDLSVQLGLPRQFQHPTVLGAIDRVVDAVFGAGKHPALLDVGPEFTERYMKRGVKLWWWGQDLLAMRLHMVEQTKRLRDQFGWTPNPGRQPGRSALDG